MSTHPTTEGPAPMTTQPTAETSTLEPVTLGGWYERTDGTVAEYRWDAGVLVQRRVVPSWDDVPREISDEPTRSYRDPKTGEIVNV